MTDEELIKDIVRDKKIMYASREAGIKCFAETYAFNIESVLFNQLTLEQQELWRKEIENAAINGGEMGLELADDKRYDKELGEDLEEASEKYAFTNWESDDYHEGASEFLPFDPIGHTKKCFIAGAEWQKQQMMKDAVELRIIESFNPLGTENEKPHGFTALCYNAEYPDFYQVTGQTIKVIPIKKNNNEQD